jgi:1,4-alpha-glucan branching enzyme
MSLNKRYLKTKPVCKVTFSLPAEAASKARSVSIVGDFNKWNRKAAPMRRLKDGSFSATLDIPTNGSYQFRYLVDGKRWLNDWSADGYVRTPYGDEDNSVLEV